MKANGDNRTFEQTDNAFQQLDYNQSVIRHFFIAGGELGLKDFYVELSVLLMVVYLIILIGNIMIVTVVVLEAKLHIPMYIFLSNLAVTDIIITTSVLPKMISVCLRDDMAISFIGCFLQLIFYLTFQAFESILLGVMAYDRYVAICNPLRYNDIVTIRMSALLAILSLALGFLFSSYNVIFASQLPYCGNKVMFWFCDFPPIIALSCSDATFNLFLALMSATIVLVVPFAVIVWTYIKIIVSICKMKSLDGRKKAFSTCSSHLILVILFYFSHMCVYVSSTVKNVHPSVLMFISIDNCFLTPLVNPIIYSFRNKELKIAIQKHFHVNKVVR